jgi:hypothetical protein
VCHCPQAGASTGNDRREKQKRKRLSEARTVRAIGAPESSAEGALGFGREAISRRIYPSRIPVRRGVGDVA